VASARHPITRQAAIRSSRRAAAWQRLPRRHHGGGHERRRKSLNLPTNKGALVQEVTRAAGRQGGIKAGGTQLASGLVAGGDMIVKWTTRPIAKPDDVRHRARLQEAGDKVVVQFYRGNKVKSTTVTLGNRPASVDSSSQSSQDRSPSRSSCHHWRRDSGQELRTTSIEDARLRPSSAHGRWG